MTPRFRSGPVPENHDPIDELPKVALREAPDRLHVSALVHA